MNVVTILCFLIAIVIWWLRDTTYDVAVIFLTILLGLVIAINYITTNTITIWHKNKVE